MASLKEIKVRIASILNTQKVTSAMKMVSSAKLHHTQAVTEQALLYAEALSAMLNSLLSAESESDSPYTRQREARRVAIVAFSSSSGLCGTFNANVWKALSARLESYQTAGIAVRLYPVGKKIADELHKAGYETTDDFIHVADRPTYGNAVSLASALTELFRSGGADRVELLYHHFKSTAVQELTERTYLPLALPANASGNQPADYLFEPSAADLLTLLLPKVLNLTLYTTLLDTVTSEHAARMMAMQTANDNANDLIRQLTLQYNKNRQQAITNELLDIVGGSSR